MVDVERAKKSPYQNSHFNLQEEFITPLLDWNFKGPVRLHPYPPYSQPLFNPIGDTSTDIFRYYFNPSVYYPTSDPFCFAFIRNLLG